MTDDGLDAIARHLGSLRALELSHTALSDTRLASIIRAAPRLERLGIASTGVTGDGIAAALGPEGLARMIELDAGSAKGTARALAEIAGPELPRLQYLGLSSDAADAPGLAALLDHALLHLTVLDLDGSRLGTLELERPVHLPALRHLDASSTRLDLATAEHLFDPTALPALRTLLLEKNRLSPAAGDVLARFLSQVPVRSLDISGSYRWPAETYAAVLAAGASSLVHLAAGNHGGIEDGVVDALTRAPWPALNRLDLSEMQLSVAQQQQLHLAECPRLTFLAMGYSELEELEALAGNPLLRRLTMLHASATSHDDEYALIEEFIRSGGQLPADALIMS